MSGHHSHNHPNGGSANAEARPYWKRAHRSVGFWIAVLLMLAAMVIYLLTNDLAGWHHPLPRQPMVAP